MTIIVLTDCPPRLRGDLTKWLMEINTGVYVGRLNKRVREALWDRVCEHVKTGRATMVYPANNEQHMNFCVHNTTWEPVDFDGLTLMKRPLPQPQASHAVASKMLPNGFSNAAHQQRARQAAKRKPMIRSYVVIDVETTGLQADDADIIEIAALRVTDGSPEREFNQLVRIEQRIPAEISNLTGITDADLQMRGQPLAQVMATLQSFIGDMPLVSHHAAFDQRFLNAACQKLGISTLRNRFIDTLTIARRKVLDAPNYKLATLATHLSIPAQSAHRALADCHTTHLLFRKLNEI